MKTKNVIIRFSSLFLIFIFPLFVFAQGNSMNLKDGIALNGYDPVSYFGASGPTKGKKELNFKVAEATYLFSTKENLETFSKHPEKFQPQYGGWCATAVAGGYKSDVDPENFKITDGKLFVFYKGSYGNAREAWVKDENAQHSKAEANWPKVKDTQPK